jgi:hypothetical protein
MRPGSSTRPSVSKQVPPERGVFDPEEIIRVLDRHKVEYVIVGGVAARLHGSPILTEDVDVAPQRSADNLRRLAEALLELGRHEPGQRQKQRQSGRGEQTEGEQLPHRGDDVTQRFRAGGGHAPERSTYPLPAPTDPSATIGG